MALHLISAAVQAQSRNQTSLVQLLAQPRICELFFRLVRVLAFRNSFLQPRPPGLFWLGLAFLPTRYMGRANRPSSTTVVATVAGSHKRSGHLRQGANQRAGSTCGGEEVVLSCC